MKSEMVVNNQKAEPNKTEVTSSQSSAYAIDNLKPSGRKNSITVDRLEGFIHQSDEKRIK